MNKAKLHTETLEPAAELGEQLQLERGISVFDCYQCRKCSAGCPLTFAMDFLPHEIVRLTALGQEDLVLEAKTIWACSACETCTTRCPNDIDIAGIMDYLKEQAIKTPRAIPKKNVAVFHQVFLDDIRLFGGRLHEAALFRMYTGRSGGAITKIMDGRFLGDLKLGFELFRKGRLRLKPPKRIKDIEKFMELFRKAGAFG
ncbi:MAG: 4Fe-4S dicluster domain-containing protein [Desulfobacteraceae bacterium]